MTDETLDCWGDYPMEHSCICGNDCAARVYLDPKPYYVVEADEGQPDGGRYTVEEVNKSSGEGEWGGVIYNLATWKPREGYAQDRKDYR